MAQSLSPCIAKNMESHDLYQARCAMVERHLKGRDIKDPAVLRAMGSVKREKFVDSYYIDSAYADMPLPIASGQTISQPYIVGTMTQALRLEETDTVLEIGTGSGYQAAILAQIVNEVYSVEIVKGLARSSATLLAELGYENIKVMQGDGYMGWPEYAPFDKIIVTSAAGKIPHPLEKQLKDDGMLIMPVGGTGSQELLLGVKRGEKMEYKVLMMVRFVPMTGKAEE